MLKSSSVVALSLGCATVLLMGAIDRDAPATTPFVPQSAPVPGATLLGEVIAAYSQTKVQWLSHTVWQKVSDPEATYESRGHFWMAPKERLRLELRIAGSKTGNILLVSDGSSLRQLQPASEGSETRHVLPRTKDAAGASRQEIVEKHGFTGPVGLIKRLSPYLTNIVQQHGAWHGHPVTRITADRVITAGTSAQAPGPVAATSCAIYVDQKTRWPFRIEWWGTPGKPGTPRLLMQMEFRDPVINVPLSEDRCEALFKFQ